MATYTLHVPSGSFPGEVSALDEARLVRDGFVWGAFVFSFLWFFWHRLWLAGLAVIALVIAFQVAVSYLPAGPLAPFLSQVLLSILIGLEASSLERWTHERRGRPAVAIVSARTDAEAEEKGFGQWLERSKGPDLRPLQAASAPIDYRAGVSAMGLFPLEERRR